MARRKKHVAVVLAGGAGTRLWPLSRADRPKPFLPLIGGDDLFSLTLARLARIAPAAQIDELLVIGAAGHIGLIESRMAIAGPLPWQILLEPAARNTAPAIAAALQHVRRRHGGAAILSVFPSDHFVDNWEAFGRDIAAALQAARSGSMVCLGIPPASPNTGYGYIEVEDPQMPVQPIVRFTEKPDAQTAARWIAGRRHFWNAGVFVFPAGALAAEFERQAPDILACARDAVAAGHAEGRAILLDAVSFGAAQSISVDYAIIENAKRREVVRANFGWSDLGSWDQVAGVASSEDSGERILIDSPGVHVTATERLVVTLGVERLVIADTPDVLLVADLARSQEVAAALKAATLRDPGYGAYADTIFGMRNLARRNRTFARTLLATLPAEASAFREGPVPFRSAAALSAAQCLDLLARSSGAPDGPELADRLAPDFLSRFYLAHEWRLTADGVPKDMGETRAHYAWAAAWARNCSGAGEPMAEIARRLAIRAETSGLSGDGTGLNADFSPGSNTDGSELTAATRIEALALLRRLGFSGFSKALEEAVLLLRTALGQRRRQTAPHTDAVLVSALATYLALAEPDAA